MNIASTIKNGFILPLLRGSTYVLLVFTLTGEINSEAALKVDEVFTTGNTVVNDPAMPGGSLTSQQRSDWEKRIFPETISSLHVPSPALSPPTRHPRLHLKAPGTFPGIAFEFEVHSLQAFQSVVPENLPKGLNIRDERPPLLPPSINSPDYNGGFLRFTW